MPWHARLSLDYTLEAVEIAREGDAHEAIREATNGTRSHQAAGFRGGRGRKQHWQWECKRLGRLRYLPRR